MSPVTSRTPAVLAAALVDPWTSALDRDHPLVGRVYAVREGRYLSPAALLDALVGARDVLLGEAHDNPDHHRLQAALAGRLRDDALVRAANDVARLIRAVHENADAIVAQRPNGVRVA